jgi:HK97 gp10 family phage protein
MLEFGAKLGQDLRVRTLAMADELLQNIKDVAPRETGTLANSLRKKDVTKGSGKAGDFQEVSVLVIAGGPPTIKRTKAGNAYDYSVATEFGTRNEAAEPFFYTTFRKYRNFGNELFAETVEDAVRENNELRDVRNSPSAENFSNFRGAAIIRKK